MAWYDKMMTPLRVLINDLDSDAYEYSDLILQKTLVTSASYVQQEVNLSGYTQYTIEFDSPDISPDPSDDSLFTSFVVMKAACLINQWNAKDKLMSAGITAKLGPVSMNAAAGGGSSIIDALIKTGFCAAYDEMKRQHNFGNINIVRSVLTPFTHSELYRF